MAENTEKVSVFAKIGGFFKSIKSEFSKIVFPNKESLGKQTTAVIVISVIIGLLIFGLDTGLKYLLDLVLNR